MTSRKKIIIFLNTINSNDKLPFIVALEDELLGRDNWQKDSTVM